MVLNSPITASINNKNHLTIGSCDVVDLAKEFGTPLYILDEETIINSINEYLIALKTNYKDFLLLYAAKAFACPYIFKLMDKFGLGIDVVSGGEIFCAIKSKVNNKNIYFHGNNKSKEELQLAIKNNIGKIVCDNFYELELLQLIAKELGEKIEILIRLTPGIECHTHEYIKTGHLDSKFGFDLDQIDKALEFITKKGKNLALKGLHSHIGSQIFEIKPFVDTVKILLSKFASIKEKYNIELNELNIGGGIGISYIESDDPISIEMWAKTISTTIKENFKKLNLKLPKLICEPGRSIIGRAGVTIYKTGSYKEVPNGRKYISVDGGMADNPRPITYQAQYTAVVANKMNDKPSEKVTIAGRYCETGDILIKDILLPKINPGDIIAVFNTGAYNYSMSSNYNMVPRPACVMVKDGKAEVIIEREHYQDLIRNFTTLSP